MNGTFKNMRWEMILDSYKDRVKEALFEELLVAEETTINKTLVFARLMKADGKGAMDSVSCFTTNQVNILFAVDFSREIPNIDSLRKAAEGLTLSGALIGYLLRPGMIKL